MKRILMIATVVLLAAITLTGCDTVLGLVFKPNLAVEHVNIIAPDDNFAGLEFEVRNEGAAQENVEYEVVMTLNQFNEFEFITVFRDDFDISFKDNKTISVGFERDIKPFVGDLELEPGTYFVGVIVDSGDDVDETDEDDNLEFAFDPFPIDPDAESPLLPDQFEPNEGFFEAKSFPQGNEMWMSANLHAPDDHDWYSVSQPNPMTYGVYIKTRPGPNPDTTANIFVEVFSADDVTQMFPVYYDGPFTNHEIYIPMEPAMMDPQEWRVHVWNSTGEIGEYEIEAYEW